MALAMPPVFAFRRRAIRFSHITSTVFENTNKPLRDWFRVLHMMLTSKKGVSALQVHRTMGFGSYKTAWYMCHRIRAAMQDNDFQQVDGHHVEADETYIGGKRSQQALEGQSAAARSGGAGQKAKIRCCWCRATQRSNVVALRDIERADAKPRSPVISSPRSHLQQGQPCSRPMTATPTTGLAAVLRISL